MNKAEIMKQDLENAKKDLAERQNRIRWYVGHEIDTGTFERNMINDLIIMMELKEKIKTLELYLQLK